MDWLSGLTVAQCAQQAVSKERLAVGYVAHGQRMCA